MKKEIFGMNILNRKSSIIAIFIILVVVVISMFCINYETRNSYNISNINADDRGINLSQDSISTYSTEGDVIPQSYMDTSISSMENHLREIVKRKDDKVTIVSVTKTNQSYFIPKNFSQATFNANYNLRHNVSITGTCSLVAMVSTILYIENINEELAISYENISEADKPYRIFEELYNISLNMGNNYISANGSTGTNRETIDEILVHFYVNHGYYINVNDFIYRQNIQNNIYANFYPPTILSIYDYYYNGGNGGNHSVVLAGALDYTVVYKVYPWYNAVLGNKKTAYYKAFVICNGWNNNSNGQIGENLQLLIYDDNANFAQIVNIEDWLDFYV